MSDPTSKHATATALSPWIDRGTDIRFKIYKDLDISEGVIKGNKETAESLSSGYVYIFRKLGSNEANDDGTRTRLYQIVDLSSLDYSSLFYRIDREYRRYFFSYSRIELSQTRVEAIRKILDRYIQYKTSDNSKPQDKYCRVNYIPLGGNVAHEDKVDDRLLDNPTDPYKDVDLKFYGDEVVVDTAYLYDWIGYLEGYREEYLKYYDDYLHKLKDDFDIGIYNTEATQNATRIGQYYVYDYNQLDHETYPIHTLYPYSKAIQNLVNKKIKYRNNMRFHKDYPSEGEMTSDGLGYLERYDYEECIKDIDDELAPFKENCTKIAEKIIDVLSENHRRVHMALNDYVFGSDEDKEYAEVLVGGCLKNISLFISGEAARRFEKNVLKITLLEIPKRLTEENNNYQDLELQDLLELAGDGDYFTFSLAYGIGRPIIAESVYILDSIQQNIKTLTKEETIDVYKYIQDGRYRDLGHPNGSIVSTDEERLKQIWRNMGKDIDEIGFENAVQQWKDGIKARYPNESISFNDKKIEGTSIAQRTIQETKTEEIVPLVKKGLSNVVEVAQMMGHVMDGFNILYQASCFLDLEQENEDQVIAAFSVLGSLTNIFGNKMHSSLAAKLTVQTGDTLLAEMAANKIIGATGMLFIALESGMQAVKHSRKNDEDAAFAFALSAASAMLYLVPGLNAPLWLCLGLSAAFSLMGGYFSDDSLDIFLKYSLWGKKYKEMPDPIPFWWPEVNFPGEKDTIMLGDYEPLSPVSFNRNLDIQVQAINRITSIPSYTVNFSHEPIIMEQFSTRNTLVFEVEKVNNMDEIKSVKIELFQNGVPFKTMENLTQSEYQNYFMRGRSYLDSSENTEEDEELADTIRILFISSKNQLAKSIKDSIDSRAIFIPYINDGSYLNKIPYYYQNNLVTLGRNTDFGQSFKVECTLTYQNSCRPNVKIIKEFR